MQEIRLKVIGCIATALILTAAVSVADAVQVDLRNYGNCSVVSHIDEFEDKMLFHMLSCDGSTAEWLSVSCSEFKNLISFRPNESISSSEEWIEVRYRFDRRYSVTERWFWKGNRQTANNEAGDSTRDNFLYHIGSAERLIFGIGDARGVINFDEGTTNAINDFRDRCVNLDTIIRRTQQSGRQYDVRVDVDRAGYIARIREKIARNWRRPAGVESGLKCEVRISQIPGGEVVRTHIRTSSGSVDFDHSVEEAVLRASPLPVPMDLSLFDRHIVIAFESES